MIYLDTKYYFLVLCVVLFPYVNLSNNSYFDSHLKLKSDELFEKISQRESDSNNVSININKLNDSHQQLIVHWVGEGSNIIICLARDSKKLIRPGVRPSSAVYYSYDYGETYINKTDLFKISNTTYATLDKFFIHPKFNSRTVFVDSTNLMLFVTENNGINFRSVSLTFTPNEVAFYPFSPRVFFVHDKTNVSKALYLTNDFGKSWTEFEHYVKSFDWYSIDNTDEKNLFIQREKLDGSSMILRVTNKDENFYVHGYSGIWLDNVKDFQVKGDYMFAMKTTSKSLFISYKSNNFMEAIFDRDLDFKDYHIADVTENRIFVIISHSDNLSNLYISDIINQSSNQIVFTLSLERIFCYFPNTTWRSSMINGISETAFCDFHKVEGLRGIYLVSQVDEIIGNSTALLPEHLVTKITFDWGVEWKFLNLTKQISGEPCKIENNCSLHLSQKFALWYPSLRYSPILSSKSIPGLIIASGTVGKSFKGYPSIYVSRDAGVTWRQVLKDNYYFNIGDHGGIIVAVKFYKGSKDEVNSILYSTDEGETWNTHRIRNVSLKIYSLMTEPGENTTVFSLFGSPAGTHQWIILKADFRNIFQRICKDDDFKFWSPFNPEEKKMNCLLGRKEIYKKRIPSQNCYHGLNYDRPVKIELCECDREDFMCEHGFYRESNSMSHCIRNKISSNDPYDIPEICVPYTFYERTKGYRKIPGDFCEGGISRDYLPDLIPCPITEKKEFLLLAQKEKIVTFSLTDRKRDVLPISELQNVIAVEYDLKNDCVFYADIVTDVISKWCLSKGGSPQHLITKNIQSVEGMAFDWVSKHLYFVDGVSAKIEVTRVNVPHPEVWRKTIINSTIATKPRGIAIHPVAGYMYWTDWAAGHPSINRANLDGSDLKRLFQRPDVEWPNGIAIDFIAERIYWVDAREDYIASSDLHGSQFHKILEHDDKVSHPFSVAVFKDTMYWDDWKQNSIYMADKDRAVSVDLIANSLSGLMDLKVYAHSIQEGKNACYNNTVCSHLCFGLPNNKYVCHCPDNLILNGSKCFCPSGYEPNVNGTCKISAQNTCGANFFTCKNNKLCVPFALNCNGFDDCGDGSDEVCDKMVTCSPTMFRCGNGKCIPSYWHCDREKDCPDGLDEHDCLYGSCKSNEFNCDNGRCVNKRWLCDGEDDCRDGSDERNCTSPPPVICQQKDEFSCGNKSMSCIPKSWLCDNEKDCPDGSDEKNCTNKQCDVWQFPCANEKCIFKTWQCDGDDDCGDGSDEKNCTIVTTEAITESTQAIGNCQNWMFQCYGSKKCVPTWWKCDGVTDCEDGSDENFCFPHVTTTVPPIVTQSTVATVCREREFRCYNGECIPQSYVCDDINDCLTGEDEAFCNGTRTCSPKQYKCRTSGLCIAIEKVCDGIIDCPDKSDEGACNASIPTSNSCEEGHFKCDESVCVPLHKLCDGSRNCADSSDEQNCTNFERIYQAVSLKLIRSTDNSFTIFWDVKPSVSNSLSLSFIPSIKMNKKWVNESWTNDNFHEFKNLTPYTSYNVKIYVVEKNKVFPALPSVTFNTSETKPSPPSIISVIQKNISYIEILWSPPNHPNGELKWYSVYVTPPYPPLAKQVTSQYTNTTFHHDFEAKINYNITVTASNHFFESNHSEPFVIQFENWELINGVSNLIVNKITETSVTLSWTKANETNSYRITPRVKPPYPSLNSINTNETTYTVNNLSPGVEYTFEVSVYYNNILGTSAAVTVTTYGLPLPTVTNLKANIINNSVQITFEPPKDKRKIKWIYGVYFGVNMKDVFAGPKLKIEVTNTTINNLNPCMSYTFDVGVILSESYGPLTGNLANVITPSDNKAAPKHLSVTPSKKNETELIINWRPSCTMMSEDVGYIIKIIEEDIGKPFTINVPVSSSKTNNFSYTFSGKYGRRYNISVSTTAPEARKIYLEYVMPDLPRPEQVVAYPNLNNNAYVINWQSLLKGTEYEFEILVSRGSNVMMNNSQSYKTTSPPYVIYNLTDEVNTFAIRIISKDGYKSKLSQIYTTTVPKGFGTLDLPENDSGTSYLWCVIVLLIITGGFAGFVYWKHQRSHINFKNLANSHYNTRSGSTTFSGVNGLDMEDSPEIREHFADDEPLVVA